MLERPRKGLKSPDGVHKERRKSSRLGASQNITRHMQRNAAEKLHRPFLNAAMLLGTLICIATWTTRTCSNACWSMQKALRFP